MRPQIVDLPLEPPKSRAHCPSKEIEFSSTTLNVQVIPVQVYCLYNPIVIPNPLSSIRPESNASPKYLALSPVIWKASPASFAVNNLVSIDLKSKS